MPASESPLCPKESTITELRPTLRALLEELLRSARLPEYLANGEQPMSGLACRFCRSTGDELCQHEQVRLGRLAEDMLQADSFEFSLDPGLKLYSSGVWYPPDLSRNVVVFRLRIGGDLPQYYPAFFNYATRRIVETGLRQFRSR
ncbi:MAG TPA: hypothetical protein V6C81_19400 [Planktothrix sp.]|jgi:hypothetical protein